MTFQEAQARLSAITSGISPALSAAELSSKQSQLRGLQDALPIAAEFDPINDAIVAISPKLTGLIVQSVVIVIQSRTAPLESATALLEKADQQAAADTRTLTFEKPKQLANGLTNCLTALRELRTAAQAKDLETTTAKAETLYAVLLQLQSTIKSV